MYNIGERCDFDVQCKHWQMRRIVYDEWIYNLWQHVCEYEFGYE